MSGFGRKGLANMPTLQTREASAFSGGAHFDVTPHPWKMLFAALACLAAVLFSLMLAMQGGGLILFIIPLGPKAAQVFYVLLALTCLVGLAHAVRGFVRSFGKKLWMTLDQHAITGPTQFSGTRMVRIAFNGLQNVELSNLGNGQAVVITGSDGKKIKVSSANFRETNKWPEFLNELDRNLS